MLINQWNSNYQRSELKKISKVNYRLYLSLKFMFFDSLDNFVVVAKQHCLCMYTMDKTNSSLQKRELLYKFDDGSQFAGFLYVRKRKTARTESLKVFFTLRNQNGIDLVKFSSKTSKFFSSLIRLLTENPRIAGKYRSKF